MWYATLTKFAAVSATLLIGLGVAWAAGQPGTGEGEQAAVQVDLDQSAALAAAESGNDESATIEIAAPRDRAAVPASGEERISVVKYEVVDLSPKRQLELERDHWLLKAKAARMKAESIRILALEERGPPGSEADAMMMEADANLAEAKAIELSRQLANANEGASELRELREQSLKAFEQRRADVEKEIAKLEDVLSEYGQNVAGEVAQLEYAHLEQTLLQRKLEQLHSVSMQLDLPNAAPSGTAPSDRLSPEILQQRKDELGKRIETATQELMEKMHEVGSAAARLEKAKHKQRSMERQLEHLEQQQLQLSLPQSSATGDSLEDRRLQAMVMHLENELASRPAAQMPSEPVKTVVEPGDKLTIRALNLVPGNPINQDYQVESWGTVALGPTYGRVKVDGLTILEAEEAIKNHLSEKFENPSVQVTPVDGTRWTARGMSFEVPRQAEQSVELRHIKASKAIMEADLAGLNEQLAALHESLAAIQRENAELKRQIEELRKERASVVK